MQGSSIVDIVLVFNLKIFLSWSRWDTISKLFFFFFPYTVATFPKQYVQIDTKLLESKDNIFCIFCFPTAQRAGLRTVLTVLA